jgi:hypothetical protein
MTGELVSAVGEKHDAAVPHEGVAPGCIREFELRNAMNQNGRIERWSVQRLIPTPSGSIDLYLMSTLTAGAVKCIPVLSDPMYFSHVGSTPLSGRSRP